MRGRKIAQHIKIFKKKLKNCALENKLQYLEKLYNTNLAIIGCEIAYGDTLNIDIIKQKLGFIPSFLSAKASIGLKMHLVLSEDYLNKYENTNFYEQMINSYDIENQLKGRHIVNQSMYISGLRTPIYGRFLYFSS